LEGNSNLNADRVRTGIAKAKKILEECDDGWANEKALREMLDACDSMEWACDEGDYIIEKIGDIRIAAKNLYSARKHKRFDDGTHGGVRVLRGQIASLLRRIEIQPGIRVEDKSPL
jgi:hypothetical protein